MKDNFCEFIYGAWFVVFSYVQLVCLFCVVFTLLVYFLLSVLSCQ